MDLLIVGQRSQLALRVSIVAPETSRASGDEVLRGCEGATAIPHSPGATVVPCSGFGLLLKAPWVGNRKFSNRQLVARGNLTRAVIVSVGVNNTSLCNETARPFSACPQTTLHFRTPLPAGWFLPDDWRVTFESPRAYVQ